MVAVRRSPSRHQDQCHAVLLERAVPHRAKAGAVLSPFIGASTMWVRREDVIREARVIFDNYQIARDPRRLDPASGHVVDRR